MGEGILFLYCEVVIYYCILVFSSVVPRHGTN